MEEGITKERSIESSEDRRRRKGKQKAIPTPLPTIKGKETVTSNSHSIPLNPLPTSLLNPLPTSLLTPLPTSLLTPSPTSITTPPILSPKSLSEDVTFSILPSKSDIETHLSHIHSRDIINRHTENYIKPWIKKNGVNIPSLTRIAMSTVESHFTFGEGLTEKDRSGSTKLETCLHIIPEIINFLAEIKVIDFESAQYWKNQVESQRELVINIVTVLSEVANHPTLVQMSRLLADRLDDSIQHGCLGKCMPCCRRKGG